MEGFADLSLGLKCGCYVLEYRGIVVYVGKSVRPFARLAQHLNAYKRSRLGKAGKVKGILFDRVWFKGCMLGELDDLERSLIAKWRPRYNEVAGPVERRRLDIKVRGRTFTLNPDAPASPRMFDGLRRI
jgi:hypothetical protein